MSLIKRHWPLIVSLALLYAITSASLAVCIQRNEGHVVYALDDPYIMMAIAKNLAQHGVWGITRYGFTSSSSSILWPLLLSGTYAVFGVNELSPLILNLIFAGLLIACSYFFLRRYARNAVFVFAVLASIICFTPLPALVLTGHEHIMHMLFSMCFAYFASKVLADRQAGSRSLIPVCLFAALVVMCRYEGLFLVFAASCLFLAQRRFLNAVALGAIALLPVAIFGIISISHGWHLLPESVLAKGRFPDTSSAEGVVDSVGFTSFQRMTKHPYLLVLFLGNLSFVLLQYVRDRRLWKASTIMAILFVVTAFLHVQFAKIGSLHRYEAYLVGLGLFVVAVSLAAYMTPPGRPKTLAASIAKYVFPALVTIATVSTLVPRGRELLTRAPLATTNIYEQQYQMGLFVKRFYQDKCVALNDIGAVNFLADIKCLDLMGLANLEVASAKRDGTYDSRRIYEMAKAADTRLAILYTKWFVRFGGLPEEWIELQRWRIQNNVIAGGATVTFCAVEPSEKEALISNLREFSVELPKSVYQK